MNKLIDTLATTAFISALLAMILLLVDMWIVNLNNLCVMIPLGVFIFCGVVILLIKYWEMLFTNA